MLKFGKFQKKKIDDEVYILCKVKGKFPNKLAKQIKLRCNEAIQEPKLLSRKSDLPIFVDR